jgi:hypothetical protein
MGKHKQSRPFAAADAIDSVYLKMLTCKQRKDMRKRKMTPAEYYSKVVQGESNAS